MLETAARLALGFEITAFREAMLDSLTDENVDKPESKKIASDWDLALDIYCLNFPEDIH